MINHTLVAIAPTDVASDLFSQSISSIPPPSLGTPTVVKTNAMIHTDMNLNTNMAVATNMANSTTTNIKTNPSNTTNTTASPSVKVLVVAGQKYEVRMVNNRITRVPVGNVPSFYKRKRAVGTQQQQQLVYLQPQQSPFSQELSSAMGSSLLVKEKGGEESVMDDSSDCLYASQDEKEIDEENTSGYVHIDNNDGNDGNGRGEKTSNGVENSPLRATGTMVSRQPLHYRIRKEKEGGAKAEGRSPIQESIMSNNRGLKRQWSGGESGSGSGSEVTPMKKRVRVGKVLKSLY